MNFFLTCIFTSYHLMSGSPCVGIAWSCPRHEKNHEKIHFISFSSSLGLFFSLSSPPSPLSFFRFFIFRSRSPEDVHHYCINVAITIKFRYPVCSLQPALPTFLSHLIPLSKVAKHKSKVVFFFSYSFWRGLLRSLGTAPEQSCQSLNERLD